MSQQTDKEFVEYIVKSIVDNPDDVKVDRSVDEMGVLISLEVSVEDMGKIIGKEGRTAKAIRTLLRVIGSKNNERVNLKILEPEGSNFKPEPKISESGESQSTVATDNKVEPDSTPITEEAPAASQNIQEQDTEENATSLL